MVALVLASIFFQGLQDLKVHLDKLNYKLRMSGQYSLLLFPYRAHWASLAR